MKIGLIAGNGRFPFLVLDAARAQGHDVTIVAAREETFPELTDAAARHGTAIHWISLGHLGTCIQVLEAAGVTHWLERIEPNRLFSVAEARALIEAGPPPPDRRAGGRPLGAEGGGG